MKNTKKVAISCPSTPGSNSFWEETSLRHQLHGFIGHVTLDGIHWIVETHHWAIQLFWVVVVALALALSGYFSWSVSRSYMNSTSFFVDYGIDTVNVSREGLVEFPEFAICLQAPWNLTKSQQLNVSINLVSYMTNIFYPYGGFGFYGYLDRNPAVHAELEEEYKNILNSTGFNTKELLNQMTTACEEILKFCYFGYSVYIEGPRCCSFLFTEVDYTMMGKCFRSSNKYLNYSLKEAGSQSGLGIRLTLEKNVLQYLNASIVNYPASVSDGVSFAAINKAIMVAR